ncbi:presqualene diphosphate synthase HpnD [Sinomonas humi]|uniref:Phytoene synthase n=1 Tax=Sinomonas humi TaxID=1338436 RepID=A0A0B2AGW7_9MICC|nr:presqualene diphosphate synthase HpnD [Sinomonas humi]KHL00973.1 phytoene synthase [Sinomonas humi]
MSVEAAYATCAEITRREARNFSYGIRLLPPVKRQAMCAIYALARRIDDIGDGTMPTDQKLLALSATSESLQDLIRDGVSAAQDDPVLVALADAAARLPIALEAFDELIEGCRADVEGRQYESFEQLVHYCRCVAGSIGRLSLGVYGPAEPERARPLADALGVALQLTNILRDLREDRQVGRVYLPREDLDRFGCTLELDSEGNLADPPERFAALVRFEAARAKAWYADGLTLLPLLDHRSAACTAAMAGIYRQLLDRIAVDPEVVRGQRLSLPTSSKLRVALRAIVRGRA